MPGASLRSFLLATSRSICVRVIDTQGVVAAVTATVWEYSAISLDLNDSGEEWMERQGLLERSKE